MPRASTRGNTFYSNNMSNTNDDADDDNTGSISGGGGPNNIGGTAFEPNAAHVAAVEKTKGFTVESMPNYQNRIKHIVQFIQADYPHLIPLQMGILKKAESEGQRKKTSPAAKP
mmetsp:Transcript_22191/g.32889  ORF Transcript_22191/g.32889 Transcript_22191/m.32889 type:complete len:114 (+) Transcript_22191:4535-4876(+)